MSISPLRVHFESLRGATVIMWGNRQKLGGSGAKWDFKSTYEFSFVSLFIIYLFIYLFIYFLLFRAKPPMAYGGSQARGRIRATAASLRHSHSKKDPSHVCDLHHSSRQCQIFKPLSKPRDQTLISWTLC